MNNINYSIIDRITALRYELQENTNNEIRIITGVRNILFDIDEMTMNEIRNHLIYYYNNIYQNNLITIDVINYITQTNNNTNLSINSINSLLNIWANMNNPSPGMDTILEENSNSVSENSDDDSIDSDDETGDSNDEIVDSDDESIDSDDEISLTNTSTNINTNSNINSNTGRVNYYDVSNNLTANILNNSINLENLSVPNSNSVNNLENLSVPNLNNSFNNLENLTLPNLNNLNNINNLVNLQMPNLNNVNNLINYDDINNIFGNLIFNNYTINEINNYQNLNMNTVPLSNLFSTLNNTSINEDVPLVIKLESLEKLEVKKFVDLTDDLKDKNKKCMIKLEDFNEEDIVRILPCKHIFSKELIDDWLSNSSYKCPICRKPSGEYYAKFS